MDQQIHPAALRALWRTLVEVPGLSPTSFDLVAPTGSEAWDLRIRLRGWSPTLHACDITWSVPVDPSYSRLDEEVLRAVAPMLALQHARADAGLACGFGLPADGRTSQAAVHHLHADASHLGINILNQMKRAEDWTDEEDREEHGVAELDMAHVMKGIASTLSLAHCGERPYDGGPVLHDSGCLAFERDGLRLVGISGATLDIGRTRQASMSRTTTGDGHLYVSDVPLPDTAMAALPGRRVGDVVALHPLLDARRIVSVHVRGINLVLGLEPLDAPLAAIAGMTPQEAVHHLEAVVGAPDLAIAA